MEDRLSPASYPTVLYKMKNLIAILIYISSCKLIESVDNLKFHLRIGPTEREEIFGTTDEIVPDYELVLVSYLIDPNGPRKCVRIEAVNEIVSLTMHKMDRLSISQKTPIWLAEKNTSSSKLQYQLINTNVLHDALEFYEDPNNMAGIGIDHDSYGNLRFTGYIKDRLVLKKVSESVYSVWEEIFNKSGRRSERSSETPNSTSYHIIIKRSILKEPTLVEGIGSRMMKPMNLPPYHGPDPIYPRVLVFVNLKTQFTSVLDPRFYKLLVYLICFWSSVNMKYIEFEKPRIILHVAGFVIGKNEQAASYYSGMNKSGVSGPVTLFNFSDFLQTNDPAPGKWDIAVSQSDIPICLAADKCNQQIKLGGIAFVGQTCHANHLWRHRTVAMIHDSYDFSGVRRAAHEIGHLFGAQHDGSDRTICANSGFIMSPEDRLCDHCIDSWSYCTKLDILIRLRKNPELCWPYTPPIDDSDEVPEILPGHIISLRDQCKLRGFEDACEEKTTCETLFCWSSQFLLPDLFQRCEDAGIPFPGTYCGHNAHCKYQLCFPREKPHYER